jgi:hypothetical protein
MCNAWNHSPGCTCGWGGVGHLGRRDPGTYTHHGDASPSYWWVPPIHAAYESYVNPNASCPVCGVAVFFYQSPNGGRVFFDELGPPWPKHPCTNNASVPIETRRSTQVGGGSTPQTSYRWQRDGWQPFFIASVHEIDKFVLEIQGTSAGHDVRLYVPKRVNLSRTADFVTKQSIAQIRRSTDGLYELSLVTIFGIPKTISAFTMASQARPPETPRRKPRSSNTRQTATTSRSTQANNPPRGSISRRKRASESQESRNSTAARRTENKPKSRRGQATRSDSKRVALSSMQTKQSEQDTSMARAFAAAFQKGPK